MKQNTPDRAEMMSDLAAKLQRATVDTLAAHGDDPALINGAMACLMARTIQATLEPGGYLEMATANYKLTVQLLAADAVETMIGGRRKP